MKKIKTFFLSSWFLLLIIIIIRIVFSRPQYPESANLRLLGRVMREPSISKQTQRIDIGGLRVFVPKDPPIYYGDYVVVEGIYKDGYIPKGEVKEHRQNNLFLFAIRRRIVEFYQKSMSAPHSALIAGMSMGSKVLVTDDFWETLRSTGTAHVVVASGMNVSITAGFIFTCLLIFLPRRRAIFWALVGIWFYVLFCGFEAPLIRAGIMGSTTFLAQFFGRLSYTLKVFGLTIFAMLFVNPLWIGDLGFILSCSATLSLIIFEPKVSKLLSFVPEILKEGLVTSVAAQILVAPIIFFVFGQFVPLSPIYNMLVLWTVPFITIGGMIAGIVSLVSPTIASVMVFFLYPFTWWFVTVVSV